MYAGATVEQLQALLSGGRGKGTVEGTALPSVESVINEAANLLAHGGYNQEYESDQTLVRVSTKCVRLFRGLWHTHWQLVCAPVDLMCVIAKCGKRLRPSHAPANQGTSAADAAWSAPCLIIQRILEQ